LYNKGRVYKERVKDSNGQELTLIVGGLMASSNSEVHLYISSVISVNTIIFST